MNRLATPLAFAALACAATALVLGLLQEPGGSGAPPVRQTSGLDLARLEERLAALTADVDELRTQVAMQASAPRVAAADDGASAHVDDRIARLEAKIQALSAARERSTGPGVGQEVGQLRDAQDDQDRLTLDNAMLLALSPTATEEEMLAALRELRGERLEDGTDARTPEVVSEMVALAQRSADAETRADVWRQLDGVTDEGLRQPLLDALAHDPDADAREEAAETLRGFLPDAQVEAALRFAAEHDVNEGVREQALASLN